MRCSNNRCINPAHIKVANQEPSYGAVRKMLNHSQLTEEQAEEWFAGITEQTDVGTEQSAEEPAVKDAEPKTRPTWETV